MSYPLRLQLRTAPSVEPLTVSDAKSYLRVTSSSEDTLITSLIVVAREACENYTRRALITQEWSMWLDMWPQNDGLDWWDGVRVGAYVQSYESGILLPKNPIQSVDAINYFDDDDTSSVWATTNYFVDIYSNPARVKLKESGTPPTNLRPTNGLEIQFTSGYGTASTDVPNTLIEGIKMMVAYLYENRGCNCTEAGKISGAYSVWKPYAILGVR